MKEAVVEVVADVKINALKKKIISFIVKRIMAKVLLIPFLGFGPVAFIIEKIATKLLWWISDELVILAKYLRIEFEVSAEVKEVTGSLGELIELPESATKEEEDEAVEKVSNAYIDLISIN